MFASLQKDKEDQWLEKKVQGSRDHIILEHLQWTMGYEVQITAANRLGFSEPTLYEFSMPPKPNIITGKLILECFLFLNCSYLVHSMLMCVVEWSVRVTGVFLN